MMMMMTLNLILIPLFLFTFNIFASYIIGARSEKFSKSYAICSGFINFVAIASIMYSNDGTDIVDVGLLNSTYAHCDESLITFLFCALLIVIIPLAIGLFAASLTYMFLDIDIWIILAINKSVLIPISDRIVVYCILYSYLAVCCSMLFNIKTSKSFSVRDVAIIFIRIFLISFAFKSFVAEPLSELLSVLPALVIALSCDKVTISGVWYADSAGNEGGGSSSRPHPYPPGSSSDPNLNTNRDRTPPANRTPTIDSMLNVNCTGLTDPHWERTVDKLKEAAHVIHQRQIGENEGNDTNSSFLVRLGAAMNETNNAPFSPFTQEERNALRQYFVVKKGTTFRGAGANIIFTERLGDSILDKMRRLD